MDGVVPRNEVEAMSPKDLQDLYKDVAGIWPSALRKFHHNTQPEKLIKQLDEAGYWGTAGRAPPAKKAKAEASGSAAKGSIPPPSNTNLSTLRSEVAALKATTDNLALTAELNSLDQGQQCKISFLEQVKGQAGGFGKALGRAEGDYEAVIKGKKVIESGIKGIISAVKAELPAEQHGLVDIARGHYNHTNLVKHGKPKEAGWEGAKISPNGVVRTRSMMPHAPAKTKEQAAENVAFNAAFLHLMPPDPEAASQTDMPIDAEQSRIARLDLLQMRLAEINCNGDFLKTEFNEAKKKAADNKAKIDTLNDEIQRAMRNVRDAIEAAKHAGVGGGGGGGSSVARDTFGSAEDETDNATLSMDFDDGDEGSGQEY